MGVRVEVRDGETVRQALRRLRAKLEVLNRRRNIKGKHRVYFVKACEVRRRLEYEKRCWRMYCRFPKT